MSKWLARILWTIAIILVVAQAVVAAFYTLPADDAVSGLKYASKVYDTGRIVVTSPMMSLIGLIGRVFHIAPIRFALHVLPFIIIPLSYFAYALLAKSLSDGPMTPTILIFTELLNIYGYQSDALSPCTLLLGWYRGEAVLIHLILPLLLALYIRWKNAHPALEGAAGAETFGVETADVASETEATEPERTGIAADIKTDEDEWEDEMKHKIINVRNLSIAFAAFVIVALVAIFVLNRKINNLHEATISLQDVIEQKGEFIEFKGAVGDSFKGYIVIDGDDNVTVVFGGTYNDGEALMEVLANYENHVTSWYLEKDGEQGAFEYCRENGTKIDHIYSIEGIEEM